MYTKERGLKAKRVIQEYKAFRLPAEAGADIHSRKLSQGKSQLPLSEYISALTVVYFHQLSDGENFGEK